MKRFLTWPSSLLQAFLSVISALSLRAAESRSNIAQPPILSASERDYFRAIDRAKIQYRKDLAAALNDADEIEVFLLDLQSKPISNSSGEFWYNQLPLDLFPIIPYKATSKILSRKSLTEPERKLFLPAFQRVLSALEEHKGGAHCHTPIQGIRIWSRNLVVFQTSICWKCDNFYVQYPSSQSAELVEINDSAFKEMMNHLMPIPQSMIDNFKPFPIPEDTKPTQPKSP